jgi:hypothetical protein
MLFALMSEYKVNLIGGGDDETASITTSTVRNLCHISFCYRGKILEAEAADFLMRFAKLGLSWRVST